MDRHELKLTLEAAKQGEILEIIGADFSGNNFSGMSLRNLCFFRCTFDGAIMRETDLSHAALSGSTFRQAQMPKVVLFGANAANTIFDEANLSQSVFTLSQLPQASFKGAQLSHASLLCANAVEGHFEDADLEQAILEQGIFSYANFERADLSLACAWGTILANSCLHEANLGGTDFTRAFLVDADLSDAQVSIGTLFLWTILRGANLTGCNIEKTRLHQVRQSLFFACDQMPEQVDHLEKVIKDGDLNTTILTELGLPIHRDMLSREWSVIPPSVKQLLLIENFGSAIGTKQVSQLILDWIGQWKQQREYVF